MEQKEIVILTALSSLKKTHILTIFNIPSKDTTVECGGRSFLTYIPMV